MATTKNHASFVPSNLKEVNVFSLNEGDCFFVLPSVMPQIPEWLASAKNLGFLIAEAHMVIARSTESENCLVSECLNAPTGFFDNSQTSRRGKKICWTPEGLGIADLNPVFSVYYTNDRLQFDRMLESLNKERIKAGREEEERKAKEQASKKKKKDEAVLAALP